MAAKRQSIDRTQKAAYEQEKATARARRIALSLAGRDIGELPAVADPRRKDRAREDLAFFLQTYFPFTFHLAWSADHRTVIGKIQEAVRRGGLFALAMPRGSGKTSICECACIWAVLYGHRQFVALIGASEAHACEMLQSIKMELANNEALAEDFPEATYPIQALDGIANRCAGQLYKGERTQIGWTANEIVLPTIAGSAASAAIIKVAGITGRIRGMKYKRADGGSVRPSLVVVDDPQTDESAASPSQCATREMTLAGAVLGLAGPGQRISGIMPCTVIRPGDVADNVLNRNKHPEWNGERTRMVYSFPTNLKLWDKYAEVLADGFRAGRGGADATEFYRRHREEMDAGAEIAWPERHNADELSAIQHAMNLKLRDERAFFAEYQNEPLPADASGKEELTADQVAGKLHRLARRLVPLGAAHVTMFIDVQQSLLYWMVAAWEPDFTGYIIDYGAFPDQRRAYYQLKDARPTLAQAVKGGGVEGNIYGGLDQLVNAHLGREWQRDDGAAMRIDRCLIDANWGASTETVYQFARQTGFAGRVTPCHGRYVGASHQPLGSQKRKPGDRQGCNWRMPNVRGRRAVRYVVYDTNYWKTFVHGRLAIGMGDRGCLSIFGDKAEQHRLLAEHLTAEYRVRTQARERIVDEWHLRPGRPDNHWLDCLVGCAVAASMEGAALPSVSAPAPAREKRKRISLAEIQARKAAGALR